MRFNRATGRMLPRLGCKRKLIFRVSFRTSASSSFEAVNQDEVDAAQQRINDALAQLNQLGIRHEAFNRYLVDLARIREQRITEIEQDAQDQRIQSYYGSRIEAEVEFSGRFREIRQALLEATTQDEIDAAQKQFDATLESLAQRGIAHEAYNRYIRQFPRDRATQEEAILDEQLSHLADRVEARQAQYEDDLRAQRQIEDRKQQKFAETHNFERYLLGVRRNGVAQATDGVERLQERALDAGSSRRIEIVQREVQQAIDEYSKLSGAYAGVIQDLTQLSEQLDISLDQALRTERLERFRDGLRDVMSDDLGRTALDHLFDAAVTVMCRRFGQCGGVGGLCVSCGRGATERFASCR